MATETVFFKEGTYTHLLTKRDELAQLKVEVSKNQKATHLVIGGVVFLVLGSATGIGLYFGNIGGSTTLMITTGVGVPALVALIICGVRTRSNIDKTREKERVLNLPQATVESVFDLFVRFPEWLKKDAQDDLVHNTLRTFLIFDLDLAKKESITKHFVTLSGYFDKYKPDFSKFNQLIESAETKARVYQIYQNANLAGLQYAIEDRPDFLHNTLLGLCAEFQAKLVG